MLLQGEQYPNNSGLMISNIGVAYGPDNDENALTCVTDKPDCCRSPNRFGEWYFPNGSAVRIEYYEDDFYRNRGHQTVRLNRRNKAVYPTGIYHCELPDKNGIKRTLYVELYRETSG